MLNIRRDAITDIRLRPFNKCFRTQHLSKTAVSVLKRQKPHIHLVLGARYLVLDIHNRRIARPHSVRNHLTAKRHPFTINLLGKFHIRMKIRIPLRFIIHWNKNFLHIVKTFWIQPRWRKTFKYEAQICATGKTPFTFNSKLNRRRNYDLL